MRKALLGAAIVLFAWGAIVTLTGGVDARIWGIDLRSRDPFRALAAAVVLFLVQAIFFRRALSRDLDRAVELARAWAGTLAVLLGLAVASHGMVSGTFSVGGSDAYGYVNQAYDWAERVLPGPVPIADVLPFEMSDRMQAPLGYREGRQPQTIVPTYAPGLPLVMAVALLFGPCGPFLVVPAFAALFVWFTFQLGTRTAGRVIGLIAAFVLSVSPVVLYQAVWPMSDVPAGAIWTAAAVFALGARRRDAVVAGVLTAMGLLIRPNLLPAALVLALPLLSSGSGRERLLRIAAFGAPIVPVAAFVGWLNSLWFGSPLNSGYGAAAEIYQWTNVVPNLKLYGEWIWRAQSPWMLLAALPLVPRFRRFMDARAIALCVLLLLAVTAAYVSYAQFEEWWYLRFLLPAFGALAVLVAAGLGAAARALPRPFGHVGAVLVLSLLAASSLSFAAREGTFGGVRDNERRYAAIGSFAAASLPERAALIAVQHGGSLRFYTGRLTLRFDALEYPRALELAPALERAGRHPFLVIDDAEAADVRARFGIAAEAPLPWPIRARMRELGGVTVYDMASSTAAGPPVALEPANTTWCDVPRRAPAQR